MSRKVVVLGSRNPRRIKPAPLTSAIFRSMAEAEKIARLGAPSYGWHDGQERRLQMIRDHLPLEGKRILDVGCGIGTYLKALKRYTQNLYGVDVDAERIKEAARISPNVFVAPAEKLPFDDEMFDVVLLNEVLEHVKDGRKAVEEAIRVLKPGGHLVIFAPNRLFPFETHGFFLPRFVRRSRAKAGLPRRSPSEADEGGYVFGNIPLINYLPNFLRDKLAPHVRAYTARDLKGLFEDLPARITILTQIYPGFDKISTRIPLLGRVLRRIFYLLEKTPLKIFGLSHFMVIMKEGS